MSYCIQQIDSFKHEPYAYQQNECLMNNNFQNNGVYIPDNSALFSPQCGSELDNQLNDLESIDWSRILAPHEREVYSYNGSEKEEESSVCLSDEDLAALEFLESPSNIPSSPTTEQHYQLQQYDPSVTDSDSSDISCSDSRLPSFRHLVSFIQQPATDYVSDDDDESEVICRKGKRGAKNILLWKFLLDQLGDREQKHVRWIDVKDGTFRFVDTNEISRLWGSKKRKNDMNFEKLSRGIRHYYKTGFMSRQDGTRLVYKFNWSKVPKDYRRRFITR